MNFRFIFAAFVLAGTISSCGEPEVTDSTKTENKDTAATMTDESSQKPLKPKGSLPEWGKEMHDEMAVVMEKLASYGAPAIETLSPAEARKQPTPTNAVMDVMKDNNIPVPPSSVDTSGKEIPVQGGTIHARIYTPRSADSAMPVIVYYHGGGWVIANLDVYDASARGLAEQVNAVVVAIHYRQAPEKKFPTAHNDAFAAYEWVLKNAAGIKGDAKRVAVVGESAGGNMACNVSIMARTKSLPLPVHQVLIYPVANNDMNSESYTKYAAAKPLNKPMMEWFSKHYLPSMSAAGDPRISLVKANLKGLPGTTIIGAEIDPLQTDGKLLADKLKADNVEVDYELYKGVVHEFYGMATVVPEAKSAQKKVADNLQKAFKK